jgi:phosphatidylserine/phosphatidylglycerophosphate/cardiolipin synthase-like enzyme
MRHGVTLEVRELSYGDAARATYVATAPADVSLDALNAELMGSGAARLRAVAWEPARKEAALMGARLERLVLAPAARRRRVLATIRAARRRLVLSIFRCDDARVLHALAGAAARGVNVCAIVTPRGQGRRAPPRATLPAGSTPTVSRCGAATAWTKYHAKYVVADDRVALVTSLNFTGEVLRAHLRLSPRHARSPRSVSGLNALFAADWTGRPPELTSAQREAPHRRARRRSAPPFRVAADRRHGTASG